MKDYEEHLNSFLWRELRRYVAFQDRVCFREFLLKYGSEILRARQSFMAPIVKHRLESAKKRLEIENRNGGQNGRRLALRDIEETAAFCVKVAEVEEGIRKKFGERAPEILGRLEELIHLQMAQRRD